MKTCNEILGNQGTSKIRSYSDVLNDNSLHRDKGFIKFNYFTDFLDVDIREIKHIPVCPDDDKSYTITTLNEEYIKETYLNFIYFISLDDFSKKFNKIYLERKDHFKLYFNYLNTLGPIYKPMNKDQLRNILIVYSQYYNDTGYKSLNWVDTSEIKDMSYLFQDIQIFFLDVSQWDVSKVRDMRGMFYESPTNVDIKNWTLHPLVKVNNETFGCYDMYKVHQFKNLPPYYKRFFKYYTEKYTKIILKQIKMFFNYD
jgi:hypothetical protein